MEVGQPTDDGDNPEIRRVTGVAEASAVPAKPIHTCPKCDYLLTGLLSRICPECGAAFTLDAARRHAIQSESLPIQRAQQIRNGFQLVFGVGFFLLGASILFNGGVDATRTCSAIFYVFSCGVFAVSAKHFLQTRWSKVIFVTGIVAGGLIIAGKLAF